MPGFQCLMPARPGGKHLHPQLSILDYLIAVNTRWEPGEPEQFGQFWPASNSPHQQLTLPSTLCLHPASLSTACVVVCFACAKNSQAVVPAWLHRCTCLFTRLAFSLALSHVVSDTMCAASHKLPDTAWQQRLCVCHLTLGGTMTPKQVCAVLQ